jgi:biopolymer transport protein ExbD
VELIPHDELRPTNGFNFAPMIDFLFLMLSLFATLAISRSSILDTTVDLVSLKPEKGQGSAPSREEVQKIHLSISEQGVYRWLTEFQEYPMESVQAIQEELARQYQLGILSKNKEETEILLHIDKKAPWEEIMQLIFGVRELGFHAHPVYEPSKPKL